MSLPVPKTVEKVKLVISDFHLSRGKWLPDGRRNPLEDFYQDRRFYEMLDHYSSGKFADIEVELVINGDFFDPLAVIPLPSKRIRRIYLEFPIEVEEDAAVSQFKAIVEGHLVSIEGLKLFLSRGKKIVFRWGNHDAALLWPKVQEFLRVTLEPPKAEQLTFMQDAYIFDRICIDHGHQFETFNHFDLDRLFIERTTKDGKKTKILNLPFGSFFVLGFINRLKLERSFINQVYPLSAYVRMAMFFDPVFFVRNGFRVAWFFFKMRFITHPMRFARLHKTLLLIFEAFGRPNLEDEAEKVLTGPNSESERLGYDTLIMGHNHKATQRIFPGKKQYVNTGTWIPITSLDIGTLGHRMMRTFALIEYVDGAPRVSLKLWNGSQQITEDFT